MFSPGIHLPGCEKNGEISYPEVLHIPGLDKGILGGILQASLPTLNAFVYLR